MFEASPRKVIKVSRSSSSNTNCAVICIYEQQRFRAFYCISFINIQRADCESCKMLIERHYNLLPNYKQDLALSSTTALSMLHEINQMAVWTSQCFQ